jgi:hypothetical protein
VKKKTARKCQERKVKNGGGGGKRGIWRPLAVGVLVCGLLFPGVGVWEERRVKSIGEK